MQLFQKFAPAVAAGAVIHMTLRAGPDGSMQVEILPEVETGKVGVTIPPRAFIASPQELDEQMPAALDAYLAGTNDLQEQIKEAQSAFAEADKALKDAVQKSKDDASKPRAAAPAKPGKTVGAAPGKSREPELSDICVEDDAGEPSSSPASASASAAGSPEAASTDQANLFV